MQNGTELNFLLDILKKNHLRVLFVSPKDPVSITFDSQISAVLSLSSGQSVPLERILGRLEKNTRYLLLNEFYFQYFLIPLPKTEEILCIGPFLSAAPTSAQILAIGEEMHLAPSAQKFLKEYYASLPIIPENDRLFSILDSFCESIWNTKSIFTVKIEGNQTFSHSAEPFLSDDRGETLAKMEMMEKRYAFENEIILAVKTGQEQKEKLLLSAVNEKMFEKRLQDPVRNAKNYCIIMNTLLRKAAEDGGVHPFYIDQTSSELAAKIEQIGDTKAVFPLMSEIFRSYCKLVRGHSTAKFSPIVKKTLLMIDSDLSAELTLSKLAEEQNISAGYLSTIFKKETGQTVSEAIRKKRISLALHLFHTTSLQVQTVAMHCGIMDVQYFSKIFKKEVGKTPKEYRDFVRGSK